MLTSHWRGGAENFCQALDKPDKNFQRVPRGTLKDPNQNYNLQSDCQDRADRANYFKSQFKPQVVAYYQDSERQNQPMR